MNEVMNCVFNMLEVNDVFHFSFFDTRDNFRGRWRCLFLKREFAFVIGMKKIFMENRMNLTPWFVQLEMVWSKSFLFDDLEWAIMFIIKIFWWPFGFNVGCFKKYQVTWLIFDREMDFAIMELFQWFSFPQWIFWLLDSFSCLLVVVHILEGMEKFSWWKSMFGYAQILW